MTDYSKLIARLDRLALHHLQVGVGLELSGFVSDLLGVHTLGTWLLSLGILAVLVTIVLRAIVFLLKSRKMPAGNSKSTVRSVTKREIRTIAAEMIELLRQAGYDDTADVRMRTEVVDGRMTLFIRGEDDEARAVLQGIIKVVFEEHGLVVELD